MESAVPGSPTEKRRFAELQQKLPRIFARLFPDPLAPQTIVVVPSLSLDERELPKLTGACHYEERLLCLLMLLRRPGIRIVYVTSRPLSRPIVDYHLRLLAGVRYADARRRLTLVHCGDDSPLPLSRKLLARPDLLECIRRCISDPDAAHLTCFNTTALERTLAVRLGIALYGCDPGLLHLGTKSGSRDVFRRAGIALPAGFEWLRDEHDIARALYALKRSEPALRKAVVKLNDGFSGEGNATFSFAGAPAGHALRGWIAARLPQRLKFVAPHEEWDSFREKFRSMNGVVESFVEGAHARSPSVQCRIDPLGSRRIISTHDQLLGGESGQVFLGCRFPADPAYATQLHEAGLRAARVLQQDGVLGRFGIDFISHLRGGRWQHTALEINLRKGGTTHPFLALQLLTGGDYDDDTASFRTAAGERRCYVASDNLGGPGCRALLPRDLVALARDERIHFRPADGTGIMFHLMGALSEHGKFGAVCVGSSPAAADALYERLQALVPDAEPVERRTRYEARGARIRARASRGPG